MRRKEGGSGVAFATCVARRSLPRRLPAFGRRFLLCLFLGWIGGEIQAQSPSPAALNLNGESRLSLSLDQTDAGLRQPVSVTLLLSATSAAGALVDAAAAMITTTATAAAVVDVRRATAADGLSQALTLVIAPDEDADAVVTLRAAQGAAVAEAVISVDAVDRRPEELTLLAVREMWEQDEIDASVTSTIQVRNVRDNYGDAWHPPLVVGTQIIISAISEDGETPILSYETSTGSPEINSLIFISVRPRLNMSTTLTVTARLVGVDRVFRTQTRITAVAAVRRALTTLLINGAAENFVARRQQARLRGAVVETLQVVALDQYDHRIEIDQVQFTAMISAGARLQTNRILSADNLSMTLELRITPEEDADTEVNARITHGALIRTARIEVDAIDRAPARLHLSAADANLTQTAFRQTLAARFDLRLVDNYGDGDRLSSQVVNLRATSSDSPAPTFPASVALSDDGRARATVMITPTAGRDTTLEITASIAGIEASTRVRVVAVPPPRLTSLLLDGVQAPRLTLAQDQPRASVTAQFSLSAVHHYGEAHGVGGAAIEVTATNGAAVEVARTDAADGLSSVLNVSITPREDADTVVGLRVHQNAVFAVATVEVDAVDRAWRRLEARALEARLTQSEADEALTARFALRLVDNYGADDRLAPLAVALRVSADAGATAAFVDESLRQSSRISVSDEVIVAVSATPLPEADATLTLEADAPGLPSASARTALVAAAARRLASATLNGAATLGLSLIQSALREPLTLNLRLAARDQYNRAFAVSAIGISATATAGADVRIQRTTSADGLSQMLALVIAPDEDADTRVRLRALAGGESLAEAIIGVDAVDRRPASLELAALPERLTQTRPGEPVQARFGLRVIDNYGDDDALAPMVVNLQAESSEAGGVATPIFIFPGEFTVPAGGGEVAAVLTPSADMSLRLSAQLSGAPAVSARVDIAAAAAPRLARLLLDGASTPTRTLAQRAINIPESVALNLSGLDQYGAPIGVGIVDVDVDVTAGARYTLARRLSADGLLERLILLITPEADADAVAVLRAARGEVFAEARIALDAVDRVVARLQLRAANEALTQAAPDAGVVARFILTAVDNYGDSDRLTTPAVTVDLSATSSDGSTPAFPASVPALIGEASVDVVATPRVGEDARITLTASADGLASASASVDVAAAAPRRLDRLLFNGLPSLSLNFESVGVGESIAATFTLTALDQYGEAHGVGAVDSTANGTAGANIALDVSPAADGLSSLFTLTATLTGDSGAVAHARAFSGAIAVEASVAIGAVARRPAFVELRQISGRGIQSEPGAAVTARYEVRVVDNYGDDNQLPPQNVALLAVSSDGRTPVWPSEVVLSGGAREFEVSVTPRAGVDATLRVTATLAGVEAVSVMTPIAAAAARRLAALLLNGEVAPHLALRQAAPGEPVVATLRMTALDQYGDAFDPGAVALEVTATAGADAHVVRTTSADGAVTTLVATVTPLQDADTQLRLSAAVGETRASALVDIDAVDRAAARLSVTAPTEPLAQSRPDETVGARFHLRVVDNYGDDDRLPASEARLEATSSDGQAPSAPATFIVPPGGGEALVSVTPRPGASLLTLRLKANVNGLISQSAQARIRPAAARRLERLLLDGETRRSLALVQARPNEALTRRFALSARDQYGDAFGVGAVAFSVSATAGAGATVRRTLSTFGFGATLTVSIAPDEDADARVRLRVAAAGVSAEAIMEVDAAARAPARLELSAVEATLTQNRPDEAVDARFRLRLVDNYGADDRLTATVALQVVSSDGQTPIFPSEVVLSDGALEFEASAAPRADADATLIVTASLAGVADATARADIVAAAAPRLSSLLLDGSSTPPAPRLAQTRLREPVVATLQLTALDQYGDAIGVGAAVVETSATADVVVSARSRLAADGLSATLTLVIAPDEDADARVRLVARAGAASVATLIEVDAVDRAPARLRFEPTSATLTQSVPEERVRARFRLSLIDNYGDDDRLPATEVTLDAASSDGGTPEFPPLFTVPPGGGEVAVSLAPDGADAVLSLRAGLAGLADAVARADIRHAAARRLAVLLWNIERPLSAPAARLQAAYTQSEPGRTVFLRLRLRGEDQYGDDHGVGAARISTAATADAEVIFAPVPLTLRPIWDVGVLAREGLDTVATIVAVAGDVSATAAIAVAAAPREASELEVIALDAVLNQRRLGTPVTATFSVRLVDNYGDDDRLPPTTVGLLALSSDGRTPMFPSSLSVPRGGASVSVSIRPTIADTSLILSLFVGLQGLSEVSAATRIFAATTPALASLLLDGEATLTRSATPPTAGAPAVVRLRLSGRDQYDDAFSIGAGLSAGALTISGVGDDPQATIEITRTLSPDDLSAALSVAVTPDEDEDVTVVVRVSGENGALAVATIEVDAIARVLHRVSLTPLSEHLRQRQPGESLTARFRVRVLDNYGRDDVLAAPEVTLSAATDDGRTLTPRPRLLTPPAGGAEAVVSIVPVRARTTLTLSGVAAGVEGASAGMSIGAAPILISMGFTGRSQMYQTDMIVLGTLLRDIDLFNRAYAANCSVADEAARAEILAALRSRGIPVRSVTLGEALNRAACAVARRLDDGSGALLDVNGDDSVGFDDARLIDTMLSWRQTLGYAYDENGVLISERAFLLNGVVRRVSRSSAPFPSDTDQIREIVKRIYLRLFHASSPYTP